MKTDISRIFEKSFNYMSGFLSQNEAIVHIKVLIGSKRQVTLFEKALPCLGTHQMDQKLQRIWAQIHARRIGEVFQNVLKRSGAS